ncbi:hypothetical protein PO909_000783 [Leuciscus waleckii]
MSIPPAARAHEQTDDVTYSEVTYSNTKPVKSLNVSRYQHMSLTQINEAHALIIIIIIIIAVVQTLMDRICSFRIMMIQ